MPVCSFSERGFELIQEYTADLNWLDFTLEMVCDTIRVCKVLVERLTLGCTLREREMREARHLHGFRIMPAKRK